MCRVFIFIFLFVDAYSANMVSSIIWGIYPEYRRSRLCKRDDGECSWVRVFFNVERFSHSLTLFYPSRAWNARSLVDTFSSLLPVGFNGA